jgi:hypothetical protein
LLPSFIFKLGVSISEFAIACGLVDSKHRLLRSCGHSLESQNHVSWYSYILIHLLILIEGSNITFSVHASITHLSYTAKPPQEGSRTSGLNNREWKGLPRETASSRVFTGRIQETLTRNTSDRFRFESH